MSEKKPLTGKTPGEGNAGKPKLLCEQWEALLVDALDGTLSVTESAAFQAHRDTCLACAQLLEEAKRGSEWLHFLEAEPEVPADLIGRILAKTSGAVDTVPAMLPAGVPLAIPAGAGWVGGWLPMMEKRAQQSRWMMTAAMAFFSIAFTLNMSGVKLTGFRLVDLRPSNIASGLSRQFFAADKGMHQYYAKLRYVYELESRVREIRRDAETDASAPVSSSPAMNTGKQPESKPAAEPATAPAGKHTGKDPGGSARAPEPVPQLSAEPVMARFERPNATTQHAPVGSLREAAWQQFRDGSCGSSNQKHDRKNVDDKRSEGGWA